MQNIFRRKSVAHILKEAAEGHTDGHGAGSMNKVLGVRDLTFMGIAAIVGAGIFSTIGKASFDGGPGIVLLFLFVSVACGFSALCYAEFASMVPVSGSAYTYSYVAFGEVIAWIIGWDLLMEYAIGNIAVAISWSDYFTTLLNGFGLHIPEYLTMDYWTAKDMLSPEAKAAWLNAPTIGGLKVICDLPAFLITFVITAIIYVGIKESKRSTNAMVILKMAIIVLVLVAGAFYVQPANWEPFLPNGIGGVLSGTAAVFFSYIGFDAISTTAEECRNPQRDLPKAMFNSLIICTIVYVLIALVLTGMVSYKELNVGDPLAFVFSAMHNKYANYIAGVVAVSAVIATASVLLVFQLGQPRIWMSMSRDGLLPPIFARIHPKYKTPSFSTVLTGLVVGIPALFLNLQVVVDLTSVGTLFAFVLVCGGILRLQQQRKKAMHLRGADIIDEHGEKEKVPESKFKIPYINSKWIVPLMFLVAIMLFLKYYPGGLSGFFDFKDDKGVVTWHIIREKVPYLIFTAVFAITAIFSFLKDFSLVPVLGFLCCSYLLCESGTSNWERFLIWLVIGLVIYFLYGIKRSKLANKPVV
ncbi:MAG: amino acid transporter [Bacteroidetes bacterium 46-16]|nr:MAG: amino acid transporter [Bacteroidetes bacterium 46-16]